GKADLGNFREIVAQIDQPGAGHGVQGQPQHGSRPGSHLDDEAASEGGGQGPADGQPQQGQARAGGAVALHPLGPDGQVNRGAEHDPAHDKSDQVGHTDGGHPENVQGHHGIGMPLLVADEPDEQNDAGHQHADDHRRAPRVMDAARQQGQEQGADGHRQQDGAQVVHLGLAPFDLLVQIALDGVDGHDAQGQIDVEQPAPGEVVYDDAAQQGA